MNQNDLKNVKMEGCDMETRDNLVREICSIETRNHVLRKALIIHNATFMNEKDLQQKKEIVLKENKRLEDEYRHIRVVINSKYGMCGMSSGGNN